MGTRRKVFAVTAAVLILAVFVPAIAQQSGTNVASAYQFSTIVDNYMSVTDYTGIALAKYFGYIGYDNSTSSGWSLGYATKLGGMYLGLAYNGSILYSNVTSGEGEDTQTQTSYFLNASNQVVATQVTTTVGNVDDPTVYSDNHGKVLLGFSGMGLKIGVDQSGSSRSDRFAIGTAPGTALAGWTTLFTSTAASQDDVTTEVRNTAGTVISRNVVDYSDGLLDQYSVLPNLEWGMVLPIGPAMTLKPAVYLAGGFSKYDFTTSNQTYNQVIGAGNPTYAEIADLTSYSEYTRGYKTDSIPLIGQVRLGLDLDKKAANSVGLLYQFSTALYANSYLDTALAEQNAQGQVAWYRSTVFVPTATDTTTTTVRAYELRNSSGQNHSITPSFRHEAALGDKIKVAVNPLVEATINLSHNETSGSVQEVVTYDSFNAVLASDYVDTTVKTHVGDTVDSFGVTIAPSLRAGLQYAFQPTLTFNAGTVITLPRCYSLTTTTTKDGFNERTNTRVNGDGDITSNTYTNELGAVRTEHQLDTFDWNSLSASARAGVSWKLGQGLVLDSFFDWTGFSIEPSSMYIQLTISR